MIMFMNVYQKFKSVLASWSHVVLGTLVEDGSGLATRNVTELLLLSLRYILV